jgi:hypothetical protein
MNTVGALFLAARASLRRLTRCGGAPVLALCGALATAPALADNWPQVDLPKNIRPFDIGQQVTVNGMPMRMQGFVSPAGPARTIESFRRSLGQPLVENQLGNKRILGRAQGEYYLSVQIEPAGMGSRGVIAMTNLKTTFEDRSDTREANERWLSRLPSGSRLISRMVSQDAGRLSNHLVIVNTYSESINRDRLKSLMSDDGFALEREGVPDAGMAASLPDSLGSSIALFFRGANKEAMATIYHDRNGQTTTVLNTVTLMEHFK